MGFGVEKNEVKAFQYYEKASLHGSIEAIYRLGICYGSGEGVIKDEQKALSFFIEAANKGNRDAIKKMALLYRHGIGVGLSMIKKSSYEKTITLIKEIQTGSVKVYFFSF